MSEGHRKGPSLPLSALLVNQYLREQLKAQYSLEMLKIHVKDIEHYSVTLTDSAAILPINNPH